ncbi:MAG: Com family DNA-binding transcriptional regulator [Magnetococcales bacterium]|nr:Com family DNA-binding transcriptional regulator [Magnetococcales bacterium]
MQLDEVRCKCGRLLAKGEFMNLEIKCPRCKTVNRFSIRTESPISARHRASLEEEAHGKTDQKPPLRMGGR